MQVGPDFIKPDSTGLFAFTDSVQLLKQCIANGNQNADKGNRQQQFQQLKNHAVEERRGERDVWSEAFPVERERIQDEREQFVLMLCCHAALSYVPLPTSDVCDKSHCATSMPAMHVNPTWFLCCSLERFRYYTASRLYLKVLLRISG